MTLLSALRLFNFKTLAFGWSVVISSRNLCHLEDTDSDESEIATVMHIFL